MPANSCKHRFYFYNLFPEILLPKFSSRKFSFRKVFRKGKISFIRNYRT